MARRYKRRQKLKRYRHSYYSPRMKARRVVGIVALVAVVLVAAWFAAPHVLDWATHTWYTVVRDRDLEAESASRAAASSLAASEAAASAASEPEATPVPTPKTAATANDTGTAIVEGSWATVEITALTDEASIRAAAQSVAEQGAAYALITLKDSSGNIYYNSAVEGASSSIADTTVDAALVASVFKENGIVPVAQLAAFRDPVASYTVRSMAIQYRSGDGSNYLWLDAANAAAGGKAWLNPYSDEAVTFVGDLIAEVHGLGFDHVALSCVQFPPSVSSKQDYGSTGGVSRSAQLAEDIAVWQNRFNGAVTLWCSYSLTECTGTSSALGASAVELGMENLLVTAADAITEEQRTALLQSAADAGVKNTMFLAD